MSRPIPPDQAWPALQPGWVWLVGAGPGDPGLMTLHGLNALTQAEVVVHDALVDPRILAWVPRGAEVVAVGKRGGRPSVAQAEISATLVERARAGRRVVRLKGGDPFVFGRGGEEAADLAARAIPFRIVPGVTAGIGGLAYAGVPVTHRDQGQAVTFVTGHDRTGGMPRGLDWAAIARGSPVIVLYMAARTLGAIAEALIAGGRDPADPVAVVVNATLPDQRVVETRLDAAADDMAQAEIGAPAIICIGPIVEMRHVLSWAAGAGAGVPAPGAGSAGHRPLAF